MRFLLSLLVVLFLSQTLVSSASAQTISETQALSWGELVLTDNNAQHEIVIATDGNYTNDPEYLFVTEPDVGIYLLTGELPNRPIASVTVTVLTQMQGGGQQFTMDNFTVQHPAQTDATGQALITVGGRLRSSGTGTPYNTSTAFSASLELSVNY